MPVTKDPFFVRYMSGVDTVEPIFRQLKQDRPDLQLIMVVLPGKTQVVQASCPVRLVGVGSGKTPDYGEGSAS